MAALPPLSPISPLGKQGLSGHKPSPIGARQQQTSDEIARQALIVPTSTHSRPIQSSRLHAPNDKATTIFQKTLSSETSEIELLEDIRDLCDNYPADIQRFETYNAHLTELFSSSHPQLLTEINRQFDIIKNSLTSQYETFREYEESDAISDVEFEEFFRQAQAEAGKANDQVSQLVNQGLDEQIDSCKKRVRDLQNQVKSLEGKSEYTDLLNQQKAACEAQLESLREFQNAYKDAEYYDYENLPKIDARLNAAIAKHQTSAAEMLQAQKDIHNIHNIHISDLSDQLEALKKSTTLGARFWRWLTRKPNPVSKDQFMRVAQLAEKIILHKGSKENSRSKEVLSLYQEIFPKLRVNFFSKTEKMPKALQDYLSPRLGELRKEKASLLQNKADALEMKKELTQRLENLKKNNPSEEVEKSKEHLKEHLNECLEANKKILAEIDATLKAQKLQRKLAKAELAITLGHGQSANVGGTTGTIKVTDINGKAVGIHKVDNKDVPLKIKIENLCKRWGWGQLQYLSGRSMAQPQSEKAAFIISAMGKFDLTAQSQEVTLANKHGVFQVFISQKKNDSIFEQVKEASAVLATHRSDPSPVSGIQRKYVLLYDTLDKIEGKTTFTETEETLFQKFAIFDFLIGNLDRHEKNWFVILEENPKTGKLELTDIKAIDNANAFPKILPVPGKSATSNLYKWNQLNIAQAAWTPEIRNFVEEELSDDKINEMIAAIKADMPDFLDAEMEQLFRNRANQIRKDVLETKNSSPAGTLAPFTSKEKLKALDLFIDETATAIDIIADRKLFTELRQYLFPDARNLKSKDPVERQKAHDELNEASAMLSIRMHWIAELQADETITARQAERYKDKIKKQKMRIDDLIAKYPVNKE